MAIVRDLARPDAILDNQLDWSDDPDKVFKMAASAATTNATLIKALPGQVHMCEGLNTTAAAKYVKLYDLARLPVVGTDVPKVTIGCPPSTGFALNQEGLKFVNGIALAITGLPADNDATAVAAGDITALDISYE